MNDGVLVSREWLERVNDTLFGNTTGKAEKRGASSLFYDLRPAVLASAWTQGADGVYKATARFVTPTGAASSDTVDVYAPTATSAPGGTAGTTRFNIIWRGRWEIIALESSTEIIPFRLLSVWTQDEDYIWNGRACYVNPETGRPDATNVFQVYCPAASGKPEGEPYSWRSWAKWNGQLSRWESLQQPVYQRVYVGGNYISAGAYDVDLGGYRIDNEGLTNAVVPGNDYSNTKTLYFNRHFFQWIPSTLDIVGKKEISLVGHYETVVTGIVDGVPQTKLIFVLGPAN